MYGEGSKIGSSNREQSTAGGKKFENVSEIPNNAQKRDIDKNRVLRAKNARKCSNIARNVQKHVLGTKETSKMCFIR
jgi:hypothetical protein